MQRLHDLKVSWSAVEKELTDLATKPIDAAWYASWSNAMAQLNDLHVHAFWAFDRNVNDPEKKDMMEFVNNVVGPTGKKLYHTLVVKSSEWNAVEPRFTKIVTEHQTEAKLGNDKLFSLENKKGELVQHYYETMGEITIDVDDEAISLPEVANRIRNEPDRGQREVLWRKRNEALAGVQAEVDALYIQLVDVRNTQARAVGFKSYLDYAWAEKNRDSYTPSEALQVVQQVEEVFAPLQEQARDYLKTQLAVPSLRPWDLVPWLGASRKSKYDESAYRQMIIKAFMAISPEYGKQVNAMVQRGHTDLMARPQKSSLNYSSVFCCSNQGIVFCNGTGTVSGLRVMLHETGHAIHEERSGYKNLMFERVAPMEIREFVAYCFQFLAVDALSQKEELSAAEAQELNLSVSETILQIFEVTTASERFQHWVYDVPRELNADELDQRWLALTERHSGDWEGLEAHCKKGWQDAHTVTMPFYNFEYIVAYLGMLQFIKRYREAPHQMLSALEELLYYGNTRSLTESFSAVGITFPFSKRDIEDSRDVFIKEFTHDFFDLDCRV